MPLYDRTQAKRGGWAQIREALQSFEGDVVKAEDGEWGGKRVDEDGNPLPPREFFEVETANNVPLEVTEELSMDIAERFSFRVNMSEMDGSFWVDEFLASADKFKILLPDGLLGKRVVFQKVTKEARDPKYNSTNYVIAGVKAAPKPAPKVVAKPAARPAASQTPALEEERTEPSPAGDPMERALEMAVGKTEQQFRMAVSLAPAFAGSPLLPLAKAGMLTQILVDEGKLVVVKEGNKEVYQRPG